MVGTSNQSDPERANDHLGHVSYDFHPSVPRRPLVEGENASTLAADESHLPSGNDSQFANWKPWPSRKFVNCPMKNCDFP